jgi:hypothetical protein
MFKSSNAWIKTSDFKLDLVKPVLSPLKLELNSIKFKFRDVQKNP